MAFGDGRDAHLLVLAGPHEDALAAVLAADPGIDTVLEHVAELLCRSGLGIPTVYELRPLSEDEVVTGADFAVWEQRYALRVQRDNDTNRGIIRRVREIEPRHQADGAGIANPVAAAITRLESP